jgi:hypothetical protein
MGEPPQSLFLSFFFFFFLVCQDEMTFCTSDNILLSHMTFYKEDKNFIKVL